VGTAALLATIAFGILLIMLRISRQLARVDASRRTDGEHHRTSTTTAAAADDDEDLTNCLLRPTAPQDADANTT